jgi:hypothetical protein
MEKITEPFQDDEEQAYAGYVPEESTEIFGIFRDIQRHDGRLFKKYHIRQNAETASAARA